MPPCKCSTFCIGLTTVSGGPVFQRKPIFCDFSRVGGRVRTPGQRPLPPPPPPPAGAEHAVDWSALCDCGISLSYLLT